MQKLFIIGNLTRDPETKTTSGDKEVCNFTVAVDRRGGADQNEADFVRVAAWGKLGESCQKHLCKGRKVAVIGVVRSSAYLSNDGQARARLDLLANEVEFLSPKSNNSDPVDQAVTEQKKDADAGFVQVDDDDLPF